MRETMTTATKAKKMTVTEIAENKYGVNAIQCNWAVVMWCVMEVEKMYGSAEAGKQMKAINRKRERFGKYTAIPDWGTELFNAYFAK